MALVASLVVPLGGALASSAHEPEPATRVVPAAAAQPAPPRDEPDNQNNDRPNAEPNDQLNGQPPLPVPTVDSDPCGPGALPLPTCTPPPPTAPSSTGLPLPTEVPTLPPCDPRLPTQPCAPTDTTTPPPAAPSTPTTPCRGAGCIPQPGPTTAPNAPGEGQPDAGEAPGDDCGITDIDACFAEGVDAFFRSLLTDALNPLLDLLSTTLLTTPTPDSVPRIGELWDNSWQILLISYGTLVLIAGIIAMGYQTVQTRHSIKELAPRLVVGFLAGALSLWAATQGIRIANALAQAMLGGGVDASKPMVAPGDSLKDLVLGSLTGGLWLVLLGLFLAGMLIVLLVTYIVRVTLTFVLIAGAPVVLMFHGLPQTEGVAYWWWAAFRACLVIQIGQSLTLITSLNVFLAPGGFTMFGPNGSGLINLLVAMALLYILCKIPFWVLSSVRGGSGRSLVGSLVKGFLAYKTFGLLRGRCRSGSTPRPASGGRASGGGNTGASSTSGGAGSSGPRATTEGQYVLPLPGVRRTRPTGKPPRRSTPSPAPGPASRSTGSRGRQLALPLGGEWPENRPVLGRDGQYRLPFDVRRTTPPPTSTAATGTANRPTRAGRDRQLELPFDPYKGNRPTRSGQYPLPFDGVRRVPRPPSAPSPPPPRRSARRVVQPELPFDPYKGNRATRSGQYPLPLDGVRRVPPPTPVPAPSPAASPRSGRQLRLPLDLPKPTKPPTTPTPVFSSPPSPPPAVPPSSKPGGKKP